MVELLHRSSSTISGHMVPTQQISLARAGSTHATSCLGTRDSWSYPTNSVKNASAFPDSTSLVVSSARPLVRADLTRSTRSSY